MMTNPTPAPPQGQGFSSALSDALRRLKTAERTTAELRAALLPKHPEAEVDAALAWLRTRNLLSDERAAEATVRPRVTGRRAEGDARLRQRLGSKGADDGAIEKALANIPDEATRMQDALAAKFKGPNSAHHAKAARFLLSRGFDEDAIDGALDHFFGEG